MKSIKPLFISLAVVLFCSFAADWVDVVSKEGRFKTKFPRKPEQTVQDAGDKDSPLKLHVFLYDAEKYKDDNLAYYLMYCDYPAAAVSSDFRDEIVDTILNSSLSGAAQNMDGKLLSLNKTNYKDFPGRSAKFDVKGGQGLCYMTVYLVRSRMYLLMCMCDPKNDSNASMKKFFSSFSLTTPPVKK